MIYWDNNATTPLLPQVAEAMQPFWTEQFFNPSAAYPQAKAVRRAVERAREQVAALIGADPAEVFFTSGGTESTNTALAQFSSVLALATDHPATLRCVESRGSLCPVQSSGEADLHAWSELLPRHGGASFALANHETGVIQSVAKLCAAAEQAGVRVHIDAVQAAGKISLNLHELPAVDYASVSAHKLHGPKGVGALFVRTGAPMRPLLLGGGQEDTRRSGTLNVPGIVGFGAAAELALQQMEQTARAARHREIFLSALQQAGISAVQNGAGAPRLPHVLNLRVPGCTAESLSLLLEPAGFICAAGSACTSASPHPSHVLLAMGLSPTETRESLRLSWSRFTTDDECAAASELFIACVQKLQSVQSHLTGKVDVYIPK